MVGLVALSSCGSGEELSTAAGSDPTDSQAEATAAPPPRPSPTSQAPPDPSSEPLTPTVGDVVDEATARPVEWAFTLSGANLLVSNDDGVWQVDPMTGAADRIISTPAVRAFDDGEGTVVYQTSDGDIRARRGDSPERLLVEPAPGDELTLASVAVRTGDPRALVLRRTGVGDTAAVELIAVGLVDGVDRSLGVIAHGEVGVSSVSAHNRRVAITHTGDGLTRVSFANLDGDALDLVGNPQPEFGDQPQILVADIDEEQLLAWIERSALEGPLRLVVGDYKRGGRFRELDLGGGWRPTHLAAMGGTRYVISRESDTGEAMPALLVVDREGTLADAAGPTGFVSAVHVQTVGPWRHVRDLEGGLELWCRSELVSQATIDAFGDEPVPLGEITGDDRAELTEGIARWLAPPDENGDHPPVGEVVVLPVDEMAIVALPIEGHPTRVSLAFWMRRTTDGWVGDRLVACSGPR